MPDPSPYARDEIVAELERVHARGVAFWNALSTRVFFAPIGTAWSPADNVRHLTKSIAAVSAGLRVPRTLVALLFGRPPAASRTFEGVRDDYRRVLAAGGTAGRFAPTPSRHGATPDVDRARIMTAHRAAIGELRARVTRWSDADLDRHRFPHPLLGKLTVREMLLFTLYHNQHHVDGVQRRLAADVENPQSGPR